MSKGARVGAGGGVDEDKIFVAPGHQKDNSNLICGKWLIGQVGDSRLTYAYLELNSAPLHELSSTP